MPWTNPSDPVTNTVITVAWEVANALSQIRWLRLMTGNADPPASQYVVVSDSTGATSWQKVPPDALAAGAAQANLGYAPVNKAGDFMSGALLLSNDISPIRARRTDAIDQTVFWMASDNRLYVGEIGTKLRLRSSDEFSVFTNGSGWHAIWHAGNAPTEANVFSVQTRVPGTGAGNLAFYDGAGRVVAATNATNATTATNATQVGGRTPTATKTANAIPISDGAGTLDAWITGGATPGPHTHSGDALLPASLNGAPTSSSPGAGRIPIADASGLLDDWVTPSVVGATVPSGLIAMWGTGTPPSGWVFETTYTGRFVMAAQAGVYPLGSTGGASSYDHTINIAHGHSDTLGFSGGVIADGSTPVKVTVVTPGDANAAQSGHGHGFTPSKSGTVTALANPTNLTTGAIGHLPPYIALNYVKKS